MRIYPDAKRALLTAYSDTTAAISATSEVGIDYFFFEALGSARAHHDSVTNADRIE